MEKIMQVTHKITHGKGQQEKYASQFFCSGDYHSLCMSYSCLFSGQQREDVRTGFKTPARRNSSWIGDTPSQKRGRNTVLPVCTLPLSPPSTLALSQPGYMNWFETVQEQWVQFDSVLSGQESCCNSPFFSSQHSIFKPLESLTFSLSLSFFKELFSPVCWCSLSSKASFSSRVCSCSFACCSSKSATRLPRRKKINP